MFTSKKYFIFIALVLFTAISFSKNAYAFCLRDCVNGVPIDGDGQCFVIFGQPQNSCNAGAPPNSADAYKYSPSCSGGSCSSTCGGVSYVNCHANIDNSCCPGSPCSDSDPSPNPLVLSSPSNGALVRTTTNTFSWQGVSSWGNSCGGGTNQYQLFIQSSWNGSSPLTNLITSTTNTSYTHTVFNVGVTYYWQVSASNGARTVRSPVRTFKVNSRPYGNITTTRTTACVGQPVTITANISDAESNINQTQINKRQRNAGNTDYAAGSSFQVTSFNDCASASPCNTTTNWTPAAGDVGIWRFGVTAWDVFVSWPGDAGDVNTRCSFNGSATWPTCVNQAGNRDYVDITINTAVVPIAPALSAPANGATGVALSPTFTWTHTGVFGTACGVQSNSYRVDYRVRNTATWTSITAVSTARSAVPTTPLASNTQYEWRVCALNGTSETCSQTSNFWVFTTCANTAPTQAPTLNTPTPSGSDPTIINFSWNAIGAASWGASCNALQRNYKIYIRTSTSSYNIIPNSTTTGLTYSNFAGTRGTTYFWKVVPNNGALDGPYNEGTFTIGNLVQGWLWDVNKSSGNGLCSQGGSDSREITTADTGGTAISVFVSGGTPSTTANSSLSGRSYDLDNVAASPPNRSICATIPAANPNFAYRLKCNGTTDIGSIGSGCASINVNSATTRADLGYELISSGWYSGIGGDIYGQSINLGVPKDSQALGSFLPYLGGTDSVVFASDTASVTNVDNQNRIANSGKYADHISATTANTWLENFSFTAPDGATDLGCSSGILSAGTINPNNVYKIASNCLNNAITSLGNTNYTLSANGVAVIYVYFQSDSQIQFGATNKVFRAANANRKILFILGDQLDVVFSKDLGETVDTNFTTSTSPHVQAAFITDGNITFQANTPSSDPLVPSTPDLSIMVEGPLVSKQTINFNRNKYANNGYPAQVVKFDPNYLDKVASQESSGINEGVSLINISWQLEE